MKKSLGLYELVEQVGGKSEKKITVPHYWKGGTEGAENDWMEPLNWYNRHVPGWFDEAVIPYNPLHTNHFPIINAFVNDIAQLSIEPGAKLLVDKLGKLTIDGLAKKRIGILNNGELIVKGELSVQRTSLSNIRNAGLISNSGSIAFDQPRNRGLNQRPGGVLENFGELLFF